MILLNGKQYNSTSYVADKELRDGLIFQARMAQESGTLPAGVDNAQGYITLILGGIDLGIHPTRAVSTLNLLAGRVSLSAQAMVGIAARDAGVTLRINESTREKADITFFREGWGEHRVEFTLEGDAKEAGLYPPKSDRSAWAKWPKDMLVARAITRGLRYIASDVVMGIYSVEELNDGIETVEISPEMRQKYEAQMADLNQLAVAATQPTADSQPPAAPEPSRPPEAAAPEPAAPEPRRLVKVGAAAQPPASEPRQHLVDLSAPPKHATASQMLKAAGGGRAVSQKLNLTPEKEVGLELHPNGTVNVLETSRHIMEAMKEIHGETAKSLLQEKVQSYGVTSSRDLSELDFMDLYRWAAGEVRAFKARLEAAEAAEATEQHNPARNDDVAEPLPESDDSGGSEAVVDDFDPNAGVKQSASSDDLESAKEEIMRAWQRAAERDEEGAIDAIFDKYAYDAAIAPPNVVYAVLQEVRELDM